MGVYIQFTSYHIFTVPTKGGVIGQGDISLWEAFGIIVVLEGISIELVGSIVDPHAKYPRGTKYVLSRFSVGQNKVVSGSPGERGKLRLASNSHYPL